MAGYNGKVRRKLAIGACLLLLCGAGVGLPLLMPTACSQPVVQGPSGDVARPATAPETALLTLAERAAATMPAPAPGSPLAGTLAVVGGTAIWTAPGPSGPVVVTLTPSGGAPEVIRRTNVADTPQVILVASEVAGAVASASPLAAWAPVIQGLGQLLSIVAAFIIGKKYLPADPVKGGG